ncbi:DUF1553 domain-containing protein [Roseiconus nitratireducens]|uniref:DUF1553 domain-containing protein n=1 Tax=Roseiconus nitratireducens TaxID=2605748 RepID=A0A5M6CX66_9BACT|nr:PSD1 and planctomycete cytochrome C domain-containing protein [Roseiconus nitratireducens]KAA5538980.1 DUF1553 domain-containing protein [Roseiconus nitratireducens]
MHRPLVLLILAIATISRVGNAAEVDYVRDIRPILQRHCYRCHGPDRQKSGLRLDIRSEAFKGGDGWGPSIVAGQASSSPLIELITAEDPDTRMPPDGDPLPARDIESLTAWVEQGAVWPDGVDTAKLENRRDHWSFQPLDPAEGDRCIDDFIDGKLSQVGLRRNPPEQPRILARRICFDLTGLPPDPDVVDAFIRDPDVGRLVDTLLASERYGERWAQHWLDVIRWAETVGFETNAERKNAWPYRDWVIDSLNNDKPYDQFVFEQIAGDTVGEDAALGFLVAGPANLPGQVGRDEAAMRGARQDELDEVIRTVSQGVLGLTIGCARCHDHKFDPITQRDYYAMQAVFAGLRYGTRRWRGPQNDDWSSQVPAARERVEGLQAELETHRRRHHLREPLSDVHSESFLPVTATAIRMRIAATTNGAPASLYEFEVWSKANDDDGKRVNVALASKGAIPSASSFALANQSRHFDNLVDGSVDRRQAYPWVAAQAGPAWFQIDFDAPATIDQVTFHRGASMPADFVIEALPAGGDAWRELVHSRDRFPRVDDARNPDRVQLASVSADQTKSILSLLADLRRAQSQLARLSAGPQVYAAAFDGEPDTTYVLHRGDAMQRRDPVDAAVPEFLGQLNLPAEATDPQRRIALARHLTDRDHPLTARVIVNRVWQHHFGTGLVQTPSDFGRMGAEPSHPELLDWLAAKFINDGWSLKKLHRLILTSQTWQQSSVPRDKALAIDAGSRLLWRYPPRRMEAEVIRDSILFISGKLNLEMGGPGFDFFNQRGGLSDYRPKQLFDQQGWRRMIYAHKVRMVTVDVFGAFDCPDAGQMKPQRTRSITPVQSLGLLNSPFVNRQAGFFADRLRKQAGDDLSEQIDVAFSLAFSRQPTVDERERLVQLASDHGLQQVCRILFNTSEFLFLQ